MTPSEQAQSKGLESLAEVVRLSAVSRQTLINWHRDKPILYLVVLLGCKKVKDDGTKKIIKQ